MLKENKVEYKNKIFVARCGKIHLDDMVINYIPMYTKSWATADSNMFYRGEGRSICVFK